ncbi:MAG TPA: hypothetical protein VHL56_02090, partial [Candidatus Limnocylindrales bacterium]|nr:hypothetical protein [Candidatus Limnocylindrales bacterium]
VRAIDLDLADVFRPAIEALFGDDSPADRLADYVDLDEYALLHQAARWARGQDVVAPGERATPGDGRVTPAVADGWRAILLRRPRWRSEAEIRVTYEAGSEPREALASLGTAVPGDVAIDRAIVDARPVGGGRLAIEGRDGSDVPVVQALERVPGFAMIARRYRRA